MPGARSRVGHPAPQERERDIFSRCFLIAHSLPDVAPRCQQSRPAVIGPWPLGPAVNDSGDTQPPRLSDYRPKGARLGCSRRSPYGPGRPTTCPSPAGWDLGCRSGKWFACSTTSVPERQEQRDAAAAAARQSRDDAQPSPAARALLITSAPDGIGGYRFFCRLFKQAAGRSSVLVDGAARCSRRWFQGKEAARMAFR